MTGIYLRDFCLSGWDFEFDLSRVFLSLYKFYMVITITFSSSFKTNAKISDNNRKLIKIISVQIMLQMGFSSVKFHTRFLEQ